MIILSPEDVAAHGAYTDLKEAIGACIAAGCTYPARAHHSVEVPGAPSATLLMMPAWQAGRYLGVKLANVFPGNAEKNMAAVNAAYLLFSGEDGRPLAMIDGGELTARRTAAASILASSYMARVDAARLTVLGTGRLARHLAAAYHAAMPSIRQVTIWGRNEEKARLVVSDLAARGIPASPAVALETAVRESDIVSAATFATKPLIRGDWLTPGTHLDLVGSFTPDTREADDRAIERASVFCDTAQALRESGDLCQPLASGVLGEARVRTLIELCRKEHPGRQTAEEITLFKSVGFAAEDLAAAVMIYEGAAKRAGG